MSCVQIIYGAASAGSWRSETDGPRVLDTLEEYGVKKVDTARIYLSSEELLGQRGAAARIAIDTKHPGGFSDGARATKDNVLSVAETSFQLLQTEQVDVYYLHAPDRKTPLEETLAGINELFQQGRFKRFGLSNYLPSEVEEVIRVTKDKGFVPPTVYQGNYSLIARKQETTLLPLLREHGISFYAYSPLAGGFLTKSASDFDGPVGRFNEETPIGKLYMTLYKKPAFLAALDHWDAISAECGIPKAEMAYRWVAYNSALEAERGDGMIVGARTLKQLRETLDGLRNGPLPEDVAKRIDGMWQMVEGEAGLDNFNINS
jgi:aflatoxin B1 aldehyde reductase